MSWEKKVWIGVAGKWRPSKGVQWEAKGHSLQTSGKKCWNYTLLKIIEADTEVLHLSILPSVYISFVAHKEYGILEKAPSQAVWVIWDKLEADQKPGLERVFMLGFPKEYFIWLCFHAFLDFSSRNENKETNPLKWSSSGQILVLAVWASATAFVSDVKILGLSQWAAVYDHPGWSSELC